MLKLAGLVTCWHRGFYSSPSYETAWAASGLAPAPLWYRCCRRRTLSPPGSPPQLHHTRHLQITPKYYFYHVSEANYVILFYFNHQLSIKIFWYCVCSSELSCIHWEVCVTFLVVLVEDIGLCSVSEDVGVAGVSLVGLRTHVYRLVRWFNLEMIWSKRWLITN